MARILQNNILFLILWSGLSGFGFSAVLRTSLDNSSTTEELKPDFSEILNVTESIREENTFSEFLSLQNSTNSTEGVGNASRGVISENISFNEETLALTSTLSEFNQFAIMETNASGDDSISDNIDSSSTMSVANVDLEEDFEVLLDDLESAIIDTKLFDLDNDTFVIEKYNDSINRTEVFCESSECMHTNQNLSLLMVDNNTSTTETAEANIGSKETTLVESISLVSTTIAEMEGFADSAGSSEVTVTSFIPMELEASTSYMSFELSTLTESPLSTEIDVIDRKCPQPGLCILWFLAEDICSTDLHCIGTRICCKVRCSMACIDP